jgi:hypothetical protein
MPYASSWTEQVRLHDAVDLQTDRAADLLPDRLGLVQLGLPVVAHRERRQLERLGQPGPGMPLGRLGEGLLREPSRRLGVARVQHHPADREVARQESDR